MRFYYKFLLLVIFLPAVTIAQSNFKPGYVVTLNGDTLRGRVDYREWYQNPKSIRFKSDNNTAITSFDAVNTRAFGINGLEYYERFILAISTDDVKYGNLSIGLDTTKTQVTIFLKTITKGGNLALYSYTDAVKTRFFLLQKGSAAPFELTYHQYHPLEHETDVIETQNRYRQELIAMAYQYQKNTSKLLYLIGKAQYNQYDIKTIVNGINGSSAQKTSLVSGFKIRPFLGISVTAASLKFSGNTDLAVNPVGKTSTYPVFSAGIDLLQNGKIGRFIVRGEFNYSSANMQTAGSDGYITYNFRKNNISFYPQIIYNIYNTEAFKFYIDGGVSQNYSSYSNNQITYNLGSMLVHVADYIKPATSWVTFPARAGIFIHKQIEIWGSHTFATSMTDSFSYSGNITMTQFGVNYSFGK